MGIAAFFDIDGTLCRNALMIEHFKKMVKYEVVDPIYWHTQLKDKYKEWRKRTGDYEDYMLDLADIYVSALSNNKRSDLEFITKQVVNLHGDVVYKYTRDQIYAHKNMGHKVFFISGSPDFLVEKMAKKYNVTDYRSSKYEVDKNGVFTGKVIPMWASNHKKGAIKELTDKYPIDLSKSYAYGDTHGDMSMLQSVGNPIAINPTKEFIEYIKKDQELAERTKIVVERKDVIYKFSATMDCIQFD